MDSREKAAQRISDLITTALVKSGSIELKTDAAALAKKINEVILKNFQQEKAIDQEVEKLLDQYQSQIAAGQVDAFVLKSKIKKQLAKQKKFIL